MKRGRKQGNKLRTECNIVYEWGRGVEERHEGCSGGGDCWQHLHDWWLWKEDWEGSEMIEKKGR